MLLSLEDEKVRIRLVRLTNNRLRLTMDFPREDHYRDRVLAALSDFLRPETSSLPQSNDSAESTALFQEAAGGNVDDS